MCICLYVIQTLRISLLLFFFSFSYFFSRYFFARENRKMKLILIRNFNHLSPISLLCNKQQSNCYAVFLIYFREREYFLQKKNGKSNWWINPSSHVLLFVCVCSVFVLCYIIIIKQLEIRQCQNVRIWITISIWNEIASCTALRATQYVYIQTRANIIFQSRSNLYLFTLVKWIYMCIYNFIALLCMVHTRGDLLGRLDNVNE